MIATPSFERMLLCGLAFLMALSQGPAQDRHSATVEGVIDNAKDTHVTVRLELVRSNALGYVDGYLGAVGAHGAFRFEDVPPGDYRLVAEAERELRAELGSSRPDQPGTPLEIYPGQHLSGLRLHLVPDAPGICGRVTGADGRPRHALVEAFLYSGSTDVWDPKEHVPPVQELDAIGLVHFRKELVAETGSDGFYQFNGLWPQRQYFVTAGESWHPSGPYFSEARTILAGRLSQTGCTGDIKIASKTGPNYRVHGRIDALLDLPDGSNLASLYEINPSGELRSVRVQQLRRVDSFDFDGVMPSRYLVAVRTCSPGGAVHVYASAPFELRGADATIALREVPRDGIRGLVPYPKRARKSDDKTPGSIEGELRVEGVSMENACPLHTDLPDLRLTGIDVGYTGGVRAKPGKFQIAKLPPGDYVLEILGIEHGAAYIKSFLANGIPVENGLITVLPGQPTRVELSLSNDPALAAGRPPAINSAPHYLPPGTHPTATLSGHAVRLAPGNVVPLQLRAIRFNSATSSVYETKPGLDGSFRFEAVDPGLYVLTYTWSAKGHFEYGAKGPGLEGAPVRLVAGEQRSGIVFDGHWEHSSITVPARLCSVQGSITGKFDPVPGEQAYVRLIPAHPQRENVRQHEIGASDRTFAFENVRPGRYTVEIAGYYTGGWEWTPVLHVYASAGITVKAADLRDVRLEMKPLASVRGQVLLDGKPMEVDTQRSIEEVPRLSMDNEPPSNRPPSGLSLVEHGAFALQHLNEGDYSVSVCRFEPRRHPESASYIQAVTLDGKPLAGTRIHLSYGQSAKLVIRMATDGAAGVLRVASTVPPVDPYQNGCLALGRDAIRMLLIPDPLPADNSGVIEAEGGTSPERQVRAVPPGRYRMVTLENFNLAAPRWDVGANPFWDRLVSDRQFLTKLAALGQLIVIGPKQKFDHTPPVVTEGVQRLLAEMGIQSDPEGH